MQIENIRCVTLLQKNEKKIEEKTIIKKEKINLKGINMKHHNHKMYLTSQTKNWTTHFNDLD